MSISAKDVSISVVSWLFAAESRRLNDKIANLVIKNNEITGSDVLGFRYRGQHFPPIDSIPPRRYSTSPVPSLSFKLLREGEDLYKDTCLVKQDRQLIQSLFHDLYKHCHNIKSIRESTPDCVAALVPELRYINGELNNPLWLVDHIPTMVDRYNKLLPKIEMYSVTHLMY